MYRGLVGKLSGEQCLQTGGSRTGQRENLNCSAVANSGLSQSQRKLWYWGWPSELSQIEVRGPDLCPPMLTSHSVDCPQGESINRGKGS